MTPPERRERIDPEVIEAAVEAFEKAPGYPGEGPETTDRVAMEAALNAADVRRRELMAVIELLAGYLADPSDERKCDCEGDGLDWEGSEWTLCECVLKKVEAQLDPEGQEYVYRLVWKRHSTGEVTRGRPLESIDTATRVAAHLTDEAWVERALLGPWERLR